MLQTILAAASLPQQQAKPVSGYSLNQTFDDAMVGIPIAVQYVFGTNAVATQPYQIAIRNAADLATYFTPQLAANNGYTTNSELQRYPDFTNAANYVFSGDRLTLQAVLDKTQGYTGTYSTGVYVTGSNSVSLNGGTVNFADLGWPAGTAVEVGQIIGFQYAGTVAIGTMPSATSVTFISMVGNSSVSNNLNAIKKQEFLCLLAAGVNDGATTMSFALPLPNGVVVGMALGFWEGSLVRNNDYRVTAINRSTNTITFSPPLGGMGNKNVESIYFMPPITSGSMWTKQTFDFSDPNVMWGLDALLYLPTDETGGYDTRNINQLSQFNAVPADYPWGGLPSFWAYHAQAVPNGQDDASEYDFYEIYYDPTRGPHVWYGNDYAAVASSALFQRNAAGWSPDSYGNINAPYSLAGLRRISAIVKNSRTHKFVDGRLMQIKSALWTDQNPASLCCNLAVGEIGKYSDMHMLFNESNLVNLKKSIRTITVYSDKPTTPRAAVTGNIATMTGGATPSTLPTGWSLSVPNGVNVAVVSSDATQTTLHVSGNNSGGTTYPSLYFATLSAPSIPGQAIQCSVRIDYVAGSPPGFVALLTPPSGYINGSGGYPAPGQPAVIAVDYAVQVAPGNYTFAANFGMGSGPVDWTIKVSNVVMAVGPT